MVEEVEDIRNQAAPFINPVIKPVSERQDTSIKVTEGITILTEMKKRLDSEQYVDEITDIIITKYITTTSTCHVKLLLEFIPNIGTTIYDILLKLLEETYGENKQVIMKGGSQLYRLYNSIA